MFRVWIFALSVALCGIFELSTAHAANKFQLIEAIGKSEAARKLFQELAENPRALNDLKILKGLADAYGTSLAGKLARISAHDRGTLILSDAQLSKAYLAHAGVQTSRYEINNWKLHLDPPISFKLLGIIPFKLDKIALWKPPSIAGGIVCALSAECRKFVRNEITELAPGAN